MFRYDQFQDACFGGGKKSPKFYIIVISICFLFYAELKSQCIVLDQN